MAVIDVDPVLISPSKVATSSLGLPGETIWFELETSTLDDWGVGDAVGIDINIGLKALSPISASEIFELALVSGDGTILAEKSAAGKSNLNLDIGFSAPPTSLYLSVQGGELENSFSASDFEITFDENPRFGADITSADGEKEELIETALIDQNVSSVFHSVDDEDTFNLTLNEKEGSGQSEVSLTYSGEVSAQITITDTTTGQFVNTTASQPIDNLPLSDQDILHFFSTGSLEENFEIKFNPVDNVGAYSFEISGQNLSERLETSPWIKVGDTISADFYSSSNGGVDGDEFTVTKEQTIALSDLFEVAENADGVYLSLISTTGNAFEITLRRGSPSEETIALSPGPSHFLTIEDFETADFNTPNDPNGSVKLGAVARRVTDYNKASGTDPKVLFDPNVDLNQDDSSAFVTATINITDFNITASVSESLSEGTSDTIDINLNNFDQSINNNAPLKIVITNYSKDISFSGADPNLNVLTHTLQNGDNTVPIYINSDSDYSEIEDIQFEFELLSDDGTSNETKALISNFLIAPITTQIKELVPQFELSLTNAEVLSFDGTNVFEYQIKLTNAEEFVSDGETVTVSPIFANNATAYSIKNESDLTVSGVDIVNLPNSTATFKIALSDSSVFSGSPEKVIELVSHEIRVGGNVKNIPDSPAITVTSVDQTVSDNPSKWEFVGTDYGDVVIASAVEMDASLGLGDDVLKISSSGALNGGVIDFGDGKDTADLPFASLSDLQFDIVEGGGLLVEEQGTNRKVELRNIETIVVSSVDYNPEYLEQLSEPLSLSVISETEDSALLGIYKNDDYTSLSSISDLIFEFAFDPVDINIQDGSISVGDLALNSSAIDNANGTLAVNLSGALITDFTGPLVEFSVDKLNKNTAFEISIEELSINSATMDDVDEVLNFASINASTIVKLRNGDVLSNVDLEYKFSTASSEKTLVAKSGDVVKIARGADLRIEATKDMNEDSEITIFDAIDAARLSLGMTTMSGSKSALDFIAADMNSDGRVTIFDAIDIAKASLNMHIENVPRWVFLDGSNGLPSFDSNNIAYDDFIESNIVSSDIDTEFVAVLIGDVNASFGL